VTDADNETFLYFAYGSNMPTRRLTGRTRTPSARSEGIGYVEGHRLAFDKLSRNGSRKADIEATGKTTDRVYGLLFRIDVGEEHKLDLAEGLDKGYRKDTVNVVTQAGTVMAKTYIATEKEPACIPYHWYKAFVVAGAVEHCLPSSYIEWLRTVVSQPDPKSERRTENEALLFR
jgi:gamma-glutamylcyclotransferase